MPLSIADEVSALGTAVEQHRTAHGATLCQQVDSEARILLLWLHYLRESECTGTADVLIDGARAAVVEVAGCLTLGLVRPTLLALRGQIDMVLSWLYFKDHPVEWQLLEDTGDGFKTRKDLFEYLREHSNMFGKRLRLLRPTDPARQKQSTHERENGPYGLLSKSIHGQSGTFVPKGRVLAELVAPPKDCEACVRLQKETTRFIGDVLLCCFAHRWPDLPKEIVDDARARLNLNDRRQFFSELEA